MSSIFATPHIRDTLARLAPAQSPASPVVNINVNNNPESNEGLTFGEIQKKRGRKTAYEMERERANREALDVTVRDRETINATGGRVSPTPDWHSNTKFESKPLPMPQELPTRAAPMYKAPSGQHVPDVLPPEGVALLEEARSQTPRSESVSVREQEYRPAKGVPRETAAKFEEVKKEVVRPEMYSANLQSLANDQYDGDIFQVIIDKYADKNPWLSREAVENVVLNVRSKHEEAYGRYNDDGKYMDWVLRSMDRHRAREDAREDADYAREEDHKYFLKRQEAMADARKKGKGRKGKSSKKSQGAANKNYNKIMAFNSEETAALNKLVEGMRNVQYEVTQQVQVHKGKKAEEHFRKLMLSDEAYQQASPEKQKEMLAEAMRNPTAMEKNLNDVASQIASSKMRTNLRGTTDGPFHGKTWTANEEALRGMLVGRVLDLARTDKKLAKDIGFRPESTSGGDRREKYDRDKVEDMVDFIVDRKLKLSSPRLAYVSTQSKQKKKSK